MISRQTVSRYLMEGANMKTVTIATLFAIFCLLICAGPSLAQARTTPVEVKNAPTVSISPDDNLVQTQAKTSKAMILTSPLTVNAGGGSWLPDVNCGGYKEVRLFLFSNVSYSDSKLLYLNFSWDSHPFGSARWYDDTYKSTIVSHPGFSALFRSFTIIIPVMGNTLSIQLLNNSTSTVTLGQSDCWVYLAN